MPVRRSAAAVTGALLAILFVLSSFCFSAGAESADFPDVSEASAVYFYHMESQRLIGSKNATQQLPAGSTVKIMAGLIACEVLQRQLQDELKITEDMVRNSSGYRYHLGNEDILSFEQLLYLAVCGSYNDAFDVLAYLIGGGDVQAFVARMNQRARELGMANTVFSDPTGISDSSFTSAEDLSKVALQAAKNELYMQICGCESYNMPKGRIYNRNALISRSTDSRYYNPKCKGLSAGSTQLGGYSVVTVAQEGNDRYLCIVMGAKEDSGEEKQIFSYVIANRLISWGYSTYTYLEVLSPDTVICNIPVTVSDITDAIEVRSNESLSFFLPAGTEIGKEITFSIRLMYQSLEAPVVQGMHVGYVAVVYQGEILGTAALYTVETAERSGFVSRLKQIQSLTKSRRVRAGGCFFLIALTVWIVAEYLILQHRRHKWDKYFSKKINMPQTILNRRERGRARNIGKNQKFH